MGELELGLCYKNGTGVIKDINMAFHWFEKAANNGNIMAIYNLGGCYKMDLVLKKIIIKLLNCLNNQLKEEIQVE